MTNVIETQEVTKHYANGIVAVDRLDLSVPRGQVYGLLGPNGAGKTTTLRMLLGLVRPSAGSVTVLDTSPGDAGGLRRVGALVEEPAHYPYLSGRDNLRVLADYCGVARGRVEEVLDTVELSGRAKDKVKTYSLGMRQRLGVAAALLKDPELLILDEPTNGLDPKGMAEMRSLVRSLGSGERTVVLSSHLLAEVEQVCDRVGILNRGKLVAQGSVAELRGGAGVVLVAATPLEEAERIAQSFPAVTRITITDSVLHLSMEADAVPDLNAALVAGGVRVSELRPMQRSLEAAFLQLTDEVTV